MKTALRNQRLAIDITGLVTCMAIVGIFYVFGVGPLLHQKSDAVEQHHRLAALRQKVISAQSGVHQLKKQIAELRAVAQVDSRQSSGATHTNARLQDITSLAAARGLSIKGVEPGPTRQGSRYTAIPLRLTGTGSYQGCVRFLHDLRKTLHDTTVVDFRLSGTADATGSAVSFDLNLCWYAAATVASVDGN